MSVLELSKPVAYHPVTMCNVSITQVRDDGDSATIYRQLRPGTGGMRIRRLASSQYIVCASAANRFAVSGFGPCVEVPVLGQGEVRKLF